MTNFENFETTETIAQATEAVEEIIPKNGSKAKVGKTALIATVFTAIVACGVALVAKTLSGKTKEEDPEENNEIIEAECRDVTNEEVGEDE